MKFTTTCTLKSKEITTKVSQNTWEEYFVWKCTLVTSMTTTEKWGNTYEKVSGLQNISVYWEVAYSLQHIDIWQEVIAEISCEIAQFTDKETGETKKYNRISLVRVALKEKENASSNIKEDVF